MKEVYSISSIITLLLFTHIYTLTQQSSCCTCPCDIGDRVGVSNAAQTECSKFLYHILTTRFYQPKLWNSWRKITWVYKLLFTDFIFIALTNTACTEIWLCPCTVTHTNSWCIERNASNIWETWLLYCLSSWCCRPEEWSSLSSGANICRSRRW